MLELIFIGVLFLILMTLAPSTVVITNQQHVRIVQSFGKFQSVRTAGLSFKLPLPFQTVSKNFSLQYLELSESVSVKSKDNTFVVVPIRVQYRVDPGRASDAYFLLDNPQQQIRSYILNQVRSTAAGLSFEELFSSRNVFEKDIEEALTQRMTDFGYIIVNVLVDDPQPSDEVRRAYDRVQASLREKEAAENEGEAARILGVAKAKAEGESLEIRGNAIARFRKTVAEGNADAMKLFTKGTALTEADGLSFFMNINEMEALTTASENGGQIFFFTAAAKTAGLTPDALHGLYAGNARS